MRTALRRVAVGLTLDLRGWHVAIIGGVALMGVWTTQFLVVKALAGGVVLIGLLFQLVARGLCLAIPSDVPAARPRVVLSAVLDLCGTFTAAAVFVEATFLGWLPAWAVLAGGGFAATAAVAGRVFFLLFLRAMGRAYHSGYVQATAVRTLRRLAGLAASAALLAGAYWAADRWGKDLLGSSGIALVFTLLAVAWIVGAVASAVSYGRLLAAARQVLLRRADLHPPTDGDRELEDA